MKFLKPLKWAWLDFKQLVLPSLLCKALGHKGPYQKKFGGDLLCLRCSGGVGKWSS